MQVDRIGRGEGAVVAPAAASRGRWCRCWRLRRPSAAQIWRAKAATEVLPLVPVTAAIVRAGADENAPPPARARGARCSAGTNDDTWRAAPPARARPRRRRRRAATRLRRDSRAVGLAPGDGDEQEARPHRAAVGGNAGDVDAAARLARSHRRLAGGPQDHRRVSSSSSSLAVCGCTHAKLNSWLAVSWPGSTGRPGRSIRGLTPSSAAAR